MRQSFYQTAEVESEIEAYQFQHFLHASGRIHQTEVNPGPIGW